MSDVKDDIKKFFKDNNLEPRENETHYQLDCFLCSDSRQRLGIEKATSKWKCFNCLSCGTKLSTLEYAFKNKGKIKTKEDLEESSQPKKCKLKPDMHLKFYKNVFKTKKFKSAKYLIKERKISQEAIKHFKLGARKQFKNSDGDLYDAGEHLAIPYIREGKCVNLKYRSLDPEVDKKWKWRREKGGITALFNHDVLDDLDNTEIFIAESEIDCISLWELGIKNIVGMTAGADSFMQEWYDRLERFDKIYLVLDNDEAGQVGAKKVAKRLGLGRCYNVNLPEDVKDPNDFIKKYNLNDFKKLCKLAKKFDVEDSISLNAALQTIYQQRFVEGNEDVIGYDTQFKKVNTVMGSLKPGYLFVLAGRPKAGKSTMVINFMDYWAGKLGVPVGMYTCEMRPERIAEKYVVMKVPDIKDIEDTQPETIKEAKLKLPFDKIHMYYPKPGELEIEKVCDKIREMVQRYGIKIFCFDNLLFLCRGENENALIDIATQQFKLLAEELDIVLVLVTHPRKSNNNKQMKNEDMKGSSSIYQDADVIFLMHRPDIDGDITPDEVETGGAEGSKSPRTEIKITSRWHSGGKCFLAFHENRALFSEKGILYNEIAKELGQKKKKKGL